MSKTGAEEKIEKNKFSLRGSFKVSGDLGGIPIGQFNIPRDLSRFLPEEGSFRRVLITQLTIKQVG